MPLFKVPGIELPHCAAMCPVNVHGLLVRPIAKPARSLEVLPPLVPLLFVANVNLREEVHPT